MLPLLPISNTTPLKTVLPKTWQSNQTSSLSGGFKIGSNSSGLLDKEHVAQEGVVLVHAGAHIKLWLFSGWLQE